MYTSPPKTTLDPLRPVLSVRSVLLLLGLSAGCSHADAVSSAANAPPAASAATATSDWNPVFLDLDGRELKPTADPPLKSIALIFILPDCPIGNSYVPELNRLFDAFSSRGVSILLVHADPTTSAEQARTHADAYHVKMPVILDPQHQWVKKSEVTMAPEAAVFSPSGELLYRGRINNQYAKLGQRRAVVTQHDLRDTLEAILAGQPLAESRNDAIGCPIPDLDSTK